MNKIGNGWQYTVYDIGNERVLKKFHSVFKSYFIILKDIYPFKDDPIYKIPAYVKGMKEKALDSIIYLKGRNLSPEIFGNPTFLNELDFEQDKVVAIRDYLKKVSNEDGKIIIDKFIDFTKFLLSNGFIDKSFNIGKNFGFNKDNRIILIDIGEIFYDQEFIENQIKQRCWTKGYVTEHIPAALRDYFVESMDKNFYLKYTN